MSEYVHLIGAEDVRSAGHAMRGAADAISSAMSQADHTIQRFCSYAEQLACSMDRLTERLEAIERRLAALGEGADG